MSFHLEITNDSGIGEKDCSWSEYICPLFCQEGDFWHPHWHASDIFQTLILWGVLVYMKRDADEGSCYLQDPISVLFLSMTWAHQCLVSAKWASSLHSVPSSGFLLPSCLTPCTSLDANKLLPCSADKSFPDHLQAWNIERAKTVRHHSPTNTLTKTNNLNQLAFCWLFTTTLSPETVLFWHSASRIMSDPSQSCGASAKWTKAKEGSYGKKRPLFQKNVNDITFLLNSPSKLSLPMASASFCSCLQ